MQIHNIIRMAINEHMDTALDFAQVVIIILKVKTPFASNEGL